MADAVTILNTIRANASALYQERIPVADKTNLSTIASAILDYQPIANEFLSALVNRIGLTIINSKMIKNPLSQLKKGKLPMGANIQELIANPAVAKEYNATSEDLLKVVTPDVKALYYGITRKDKYPVTISESLIRQAILNDGSMSELINLIVNSLYSGDNMDEFMMMKQIVADATTKGNVKVVPMTFRPDNMTADDGKTLIKQLRTDSGLLAFPSDNYNSYAKLLPNDSTEKPLITFTEIPDQILLIDSRVYSSVTVDVLATAFNIDKTDFIGKVIPVDNFNGSPVIAMLCDTAWFRVYDNEYKTTSMYNPDTLNYHYWLHHWQVMQYSMFANAIVYTYEPQQA